MKKAIFIISLITGLLPASLSAQINIDSLDCSRPKYVVIPKYENCVTRSTASVTSEEAGWLTRPYMYATDEKTDNGWYKLIDGYVNSKDVNLLTEFDTFIPPSEYYGDFYGMAYDMDAQFYWKLHDLPGTDLYLIYNYPGTLYLGKMLNTNMLLMAARINLVFQYDDENPEKFDVKYEDNSEYASMVVITYGLKYGQFFVDECDNYVTFNMKHLKKKLIRGLFARYGEPANLVFTTEHFTEEMFVGNNAWIDANYLNVSPEDFEKYVINADEE